MTKTWRVGAALVALLWAGCSADKAEPDMARPDAGTQSDASTEPDPPPSDGTRFLMDYAASVCAMYEPCCNEAGLGFAASGCTTWFRKVTAAYFKGTFSADGAQRCLGMLSDAREADAQRCANVSSFDAATLRSECQQAFAPLARDGNAIGGKCLLGADCAQASGETVICYSRVCVRELRGSEGDGPCYIGGTSGIEGVPDEIVTCHVEDGVFCHRGENACKPQVQDGEYCPYPNACQTTAQCIGGLCKVLPGEGESCLNGIPGAGGFCKPGTACDRSTLTCGPPLEEGVACREPAECTSGTCMGGKCTKPEFTRALNCTGG
jgi:hypothetical protein